MSLMTIPTLAENDTSSVTSRIEDTIHAVEIKTPDGWHETKGFSQIPESFEFNGLVFQGVKFKNGTEQHGAAIFFATDLDNDNDKISEAALAQAHAQFQEMAFPGMQLSHLIFTVFNVNGSITAHKATLSGSLEGSLSNASGNSSIVKVSGKIEGDTETNNFAFGTGKLTLQSTEPLYGATGVLLTDNYQLIIIAWGADEATLENDLNIFKDALVITAKAPKPKSVAEPAALKEEVAAPAVPAAKGEEPVAAAEEVQQVTLPAEPIAKGEEPKQIEIPAVPAAAIEEAKLAEAPAEVVQAVAEAVHSHPNV